MAGVKGRSGGARPGAGRKPKEPTILALAATYDDPEKFLRAVMNDSATDAKVRVDAAKALMPFVHAKKGAAAGKPDGQVKPGTARYGVRQGPRLVASRS
jgi:phage terminase small subunit